MKRIVSLAIVLFIIITTASGCKIGNNSIKDSTEIVTDESEAQEDPTEEIHNNEYFRIYTGSDLENRFYYYYDIFDLSGNVIKSECTYMCDPKITPVGEYVLKISAQAGTGKPTVWTYYYDIEKNAVSPIYCYVLCESKELIAYFDGNKLIVSGMFDDEECYKEIELGEKLSVCAEPIINAVFSDNSNSITVTYLSGDCFQETVETIDIQ